MSDWWESAPVVNPPAGGDDWWKAAPVVGGKGGATPPADAGAAPKGVQALVAPVTSLPGAYSDMVHQAVAQMQRGAGQIESGAGEVGNGNYWQGAKDLAKGAGNAVLGAGSYVGAPINAPIHTFVGEPVKNSVTAATGSKRVGELVGSTAELAAGFAIPGPGEMKLATEAEKATTAAAPTASELRAAAKAGFQSPEIAQLNIRPSAATQWGDVLKTDLFKDGIDANLAPKTFGVLKQLESAPAGSFVNGNGLQSLRRMLGRAAGTADPTEKAAASRAIESLDKFVENVPKDAVISGDPAKAAQAWAGARGNYAAMKRDETIGTALDKAQRQADSANSGANVGNSVRQRIKTILNSDKARRGFSSDELEQMEAIVKGTPVQNTTRKVSNLLGGGGGLGSAAVSAIGAAATGPVGAMAPIVGWGLKKLEGKMALSDIENLRSAVRSRSPLGEQMSAPIRKWSEAQVSFEASPGAKTLSRLVLSSRNLSNNLKDAGVDIGPDELMGDQGRDKDRDPH